MDKTEWQLDAQAKRVLAIFAGENPWRDDFEMATEHARSADPESLYNCGSRGPYIKDVRRGGGEVRGDVQLTSALRGREGVSQILTKGREVA